MKTPKKLIVGILFISILLIIANIRTQSKSIDTNTIASVKNEKILIIVMTSDKTFLERIPTLWETWGSKTNILLSCNCENLTKQFELDSENPVTKQLANLSIMQMNITEDYDKMGTKTLKVIKTVYERYNSLYNWFMLVDDDTFVFVENLNTFVSKLNNSLEFTYGYNFKTVVEGGYHSGGGGILFTKESLKRLYKGIIEGKCDDTDTYYGDVAIGECSRKTGVMLGNSLDEKNRERFHR